VTLFGKIDGQGREEMGKVLKELEKELNGTIGRYFEGNANIVEETHARLRYLKPYYVPEVITDQVSQAVQQLVGFTGLVMI